MSLPNKYNKLANSQISNMTLFEYMFGVVIQGMFANPNINIKNIKLKDYSDIMSAAITAANFSIATLYENNIEKENKENNIEDIKIN